MRKKLLIVIGIVLAIYIVFVTADCIRLGNSSDETKPFITVSSVEEESRIKHTGLGYSVEYYIDEIENKDVYGAELRLFDTILIWAWIE